MLFHPKQMLHELVTYPFPEDYGVFLNERANVVDYT